MSDHSSEGNPELLSVTQVAGELGVTRQRVHELIKNGQIVAQTWTLLLHRGSRDATL